MPQRTKLYSQREPDGKAAHEGAAQLMSGDWQIPLPFTIAALPARAAFKARWLLLTHEVLPRMAKRYNWPISQNHCFMRVCLDASLGAPWHTVVKQPALHQMTDAQLQDAIAVAERLVETPSLLFHLNSHSIAGRKSLRAC